MTTARKTIETRRCAYCDCAVCLESTGERSCSWCGVRYRIEDGKPEITGECVSMGLQTGGGT
jgi:hypothetical protein